MSDRLPDDDAETPAPAKPRLRRRLAVVGVAVLAALGLARVYGIGGLGGNDETSGKCAAAPAAAVDLVPHAADELAALAPSDRPRDLSALAFVGSDGKPTTLADWNGRVVLLNLWATWCPPCRAEMPSLDRLQARLGSKDFEVVTVNLDSRDPDRPKRFLADIGVAALAHRSDPTLGVFKALQKIGLASGLPTTVLIDRQGCELATFAGPAHWDGASAVSLVEAALRR
ncbi:MAG: TlpA family protein disulfide reductase [Hyphomicrobiales bacterium]|nr:TlpA family protein disulfide reductase [Hyphomicrobiales bacterium]